MVMNTDYDRVYSFDMDQYLIENYPTMNMPTRRTICHLAFDWNDSTFVEETIDEVVADYAKTQLNIAKKEDEDEEEE